jgi:hypothetical protein
VLSSSRRRLLRDPIGDGSSRGASFGSDPFAANALARRSAP